MNFLEKPPAMFSSFFRYCYGNPFSASKKLLPLFQLIIGKGLYGQHTLFGMVI